MTATTRAYQVPEASASLELVERELPDPGRWQVRVRVTASAICHSDVMVSGGMASSYPRVPGHEVVGVVDAVGEGVSTWEPGQRVGIGWFGGACFVCEQCRRGDFIHCRRMGITGLTSDGGYAEHVLVAADALAAVPDALTDTEAAPLLCAGVTTFNGLRHSGARPGELVAVLGLGGLGHLGVQFAAKMGNEVVAIARGEEKGELARSLGAHHYLDSTSVDVGRELTRLGRAKVVLATVTKAAAMNPTVAGLRPDGRLVVLGVDTEPVSAQPMDLVGASRGVVGHPSGTSQDSEDTMRFAALTGVRPMIETMPLERAAEGFERMLSGQARFRVVLTP